MRNMIKTRLEGEQQLHEWNALLQNALRAPVDHRQVREILWKLNDIEADILGLEIKASCPTEPDLPQDAVFLRTNS